MIESLSERTFQQKSKITEFIFEHTVHQDTTKKSGDIHTMYWRNEDLIAKRAQHGEFIWSNIRAGKVDFARHLERFFSLHILYI